MRWNFLAGVVSECCIARDHTCVCVCARVCVGVFVRVCAYVCMSISVCLLPQNLLEGAVSECCMHLHLCVCVFECASVCVCVRACVRVCMCVMQCIQWRLPILSPCATLPADG